MLPLVQLIWVTLRLKLGQEPAVDPLADGVYLYMADGRLGAVFIQGTVDFPKQLAILLARILMRDGAQPDEVRSAGKFFSVGVALALWSVLLQVVIPAGRGLLLLRRDPRVGEKPLRVAGRAVALVATAVVLIFVVPVPLWTVAEGVVWLPQQAQVRTGTAGVVTRILVDSGTQVRRGQPLLELRDALLARGIRVAVGLGDYRSTCIRIGHMGDIRPDDIGRTMDALAGALQGRSAER